MARSNADKRKAVEVALREFGGLPNTEVAKLCGVNDKTVAAVRKDRRSELPNVTPETITDSLGRQQPARKPRKPREQVPPMPGAVEYRPEPCLSVDGRERSRSIAENVKNSLQNECQGERWGMSKTHCKRLITGSLVASELSPMGDKITNERQARELAKLYRASHSIFENYCRERWSISRRRAYQLITARETVESLTEDVKNFTQNEAQLNELAKVEPERRAEVLEKVSSEGLSFPC